MWEGQQWGWGGNQGGQQRPRPGQTLGNLNRKLEELVQTPPFNFLAQHMLIGV